MTSVLHLFNAEYSVGLVPSTYPYSALKSPHASHPITDPLQSSQSFQIIHDGACFLRRDKIRMVASWQKAMQNLHVCWKEEDDTNCGKCGKCVRKILGFRANKLEVPPCFDYIPTNLDILFLGLTPVSELQEILDLAEKNEVDEPWVKLLKFNILLHRFRGKFSQLGQLFSLS